MSTATLTSLAILKVNLDRGGDYLDYLRPFVLQVLADNRPERVSDAEVSRFIEDQFGLVIPSRSIQIILRRLSKEKVLIRSNHVFVPGTIDDPGMHASQADAARKIQVTIDAVVNYARQTAGLELSDDEANQAICSFLSHFDVSCLRAYLRNTAIPPVPGSHGRQSALVGKYVLHIRKDPDLFENFMVVVQGHMLANALLCPDLRSSATFRGVTFYLDTPLLIHQLGLEGSGKKVAVDELTRLLRELGGKIAIFSHSRKELDHVLYGAAQHLDAPDGRGGIVMEARRVGTTKSDLLLTRANVDDWLAAQDVEVRRTPEYDDAFQIDEKAFEHMLDDEAAHYNETAMAYDVNSARSVYALRGGRPSPTIERSRAILVTSNTAFAKAAWQYGQEEEVSKDVSSVISDFSLANIAWLKAPMGATSLPVAEVMAYSYAAVQPSSTLMDKFLKEIDKLHAKGGVSQRDHQLLRSSTLTYDKIMDLTLGDEAALTQESILETLERIKKDVHGEKARELSAEQKAHDKTRTELEESALEVSRLRDRLYWSCVKRARVVTCGLLIVVGLLVTSGLLTQSAQVGYWLTRALGASVSEVLLYVHLVATAISLGFGISLLTLYRRVYRRFLGYFVRREGVVGSAASDAGSFKGDDASRRTS